MSRPRTSCTYNGPQRLCSGQWQRSFYHPRPTNGSHCGTSRTHSRKLTSINSCSDRPSPAPETNPAVTGQVPAPLDHFTELEKQRLYIAQKKVFYTYKVEEKALCSLILNSVDDQYINHLKDAKTKYSKVAPRTILESLWKSYEKVEVSDLSANDKRMKVQWNPPTPVSNLWKQLSDGRKFAHAGKETISTSQLTRFAYNNIAATGLFNADLAKWRRETIHFSSMT